MSLKLSIYNLIDREKLNVTQINFENFEINFDLDKIYKYKKFLYNKFYSKRVNFSKGKINFLEDKKHIATVENVNFEYNPKGDAFEAALDGDFIGDKIIINFENNKNRKPSKIFVVKLSNLGLFTKVNIIDNDLNKDKDILTGNFLFKKNKNRLTAIFDYKNGKIVIKNSNLRNEFLDGKLNGKVKFLPYFDFDLNLDLNSVNFNRLYNLLVSLNDKNRRELFKINKKMNGKLALSANKIFSKHTLINSFESQIKFINGNIIFEQALFNLGKLGATDITGIIKNDEKFSNFRFENNIYLDNLKRFYSKFGIYNKQKIPYNLFISGNLDLVKFILRLDEISDEEKFKDEDIKYIENEFNDLVLEEGYATLFNFARFKEFIKLIATESN